VQCCFYSGNESIQHLFFECVMARVIWGFVSEFLGFDIGTNYISVASRWLLKNKCYVVNVISTAVLRGIWLIRNDMIFNKQDWTGIKAVLRRVYRLSMEWKIIIKEVKMGEMETWLYFLDQLIQKPLKIKGD
jgi:hypothetical protein